MISRGESERERVRRKKNGGSYKARCNNSHRFYSDPFSIGRDRLGMAFILH